ncbi:hypothetical protein ACJMK2_040455 [Sinanodonta woodiana]
MIDIMEEYQKYVPLKPNGEPFTIPLHADGLSCERGHDAQSARINANSAWQQLQGLEMTIQEWHKRCLLLQDVYDELYRSSGRDRGTLYQLKNYFNHRNVTSNVKDSFNFNEEFLDFCCNGYTVLAAMHYMQTEHLNDTPSDFPESLQDKLIYLDRVATQIVDMVFLSSLPTVQKILKSEEQAARDDSYSDYCICKQDIPGSDMIFCENRNCDRGIWFHLECIEMDVENVPDGNWFCSNDCETAVFNKKSMKERKKKTVAESLNDNKRNYTILVMWKGLNQQVRRDAIRENDGERMLLHWRFDMLQFFEKHHTKYFIVGHRLLSAVSGAVSPRLQMSLIWNRTVNPHGGHGRNIEMDLQMEFYNKEYKESVKDAGGHLTSATIARHSQMVGVGKILRSVYDKHVSDLSGRTVHKSARVDRQKDIKEFVSLLEHEDLFTLHPGRSYMSFPAVNLHLYPRLTPKAFKSRLVKHRQHLSKRREIIKQMQKN